MSRARAPVAMAAWLPLALLGAACQPKPAGEIMVVIDTDMSVPKDLDTISIAVSRADTDAGLFTSPLLITGGTKGLPTTLAVVAGPDPSIPVSIRVAALQGGLERVVRTATTTVPEDRVAMLRLPLQWLCDGNTTCATGATCIAGACARPDVDSTTLPVYHEEEVFGGGTATRGSHCFDAFHCFGGFAAVEPDASCTIPRTGDVNVAVETTGEGICGPDGCFVALDANSPLGWTRSADGSRIQLPPAVCKLPPAKMCHVVTAVTSGDCPLKTAALPTCGPWSSAGPFFAPAGTTEPVTVASCQNHPADLTIDPISDRVFWANRGTPPAEADGEIKMLSTEGGTPTKVIDGQGGLAGVVATAEKMFWTTSTSAEVCDLDPTLRTCASAPEVRGNPLATRGVAALQSTLCWTEWVAGRVHCGGGTRDFDSYLHPSPFRIAFGDDEKHVVWTDEGSGPEHTDGSVWMAVLDDGTSYQTPVWYFHSMAPLADPTQRWPRFVVVNGSSIFWTTFGDVKAMTGGSVMTAELPKLPTGAPCLKDERCCSSKCANGTCTEAPCPADTPTRLTATPGPHDLPNGIATDGNAIFWTDFGTNQVKTATMKGTEQTSLASRQRQPGAIAVDASNVYWIVGGANGRVMKINKPIKKP